MRRESLLLPLDLRAPGAARAFVRTILTTWGYHDLDDVDTVTLVVSELITNVVQHANEPNHPLRLDLQMGHCLRVAVMDGSAVEPVVRELDDTADAGRGMHLVSSLVDRWGFQRLEDGKRVWVELDSLTRSGGGQVTP